MSGRKRKKADRGGDAWYQASWMTGLLLAAIGLYFGLSLTGPAGDWAQAFGGAAPRQIIPNQNPGGPVGSFANVGLRLVFGGLWCWLVPATLVWVGLGRLVGRAAPLRGWLMRVVPLWLASAAFLAQPSGIFDQETGIRLGGGVGFYVARGFHGVFGLAGGRLFLGLITIVVLVLVMRPWLGGVIHGAAVVGRGMLAPLRALLAWALDLGDAAADWRRRRREGRIRGSETYMAADLSGDGAESARDGLRERRVHEAPIGSEEEPGEVPAPTGEPARLLPGASGEFHGDDPGARPAGARTVPKPPRRKSGPMALPGLDLLTPAGPEGQAVSAVELDAAADLLEATLRSFGVEGEVKDVRPGPVVTTFEYQPGSGVRVSQIVQRSDDLALAMRARSIRMEAPIPGKAAVGIEIPNPTARMVRLREVLELTRGQAREPLSVVLGKDVVGRPVGIDLATLPHLLVAGSTGSGKSVCLNAIISNLLLRNDPTRLRMVLIDPKMLEMNVYNGIPHLLLPVVTDPREALKALQWMVAQMELRYRQLAKWSVRNIKQYNEKIARGEVQGEGGETLTEPMPYYLTIVDELADLMLQLGNDFEGPITRLAQKARAVGIHLILATQRPSVDVLTGVIKANIPCRIAFRVIQRNDSRTILDMNGAEQLLGHGDMLYLQPGRALPVRVHGSFIDVDECEAVAAHWRHYEGATEEISLDSGRDGGGNYTGEDELFEDARRVVVLHQSGSTSLLQRRLRIGYTRAGRLMDMLEEAGIVGPFTGSKARDVLIEPEDLPGLEGEA